MLDIHLLKDNHNTWLLNINPWFISAEISALMAAAGQDPERGWDLESGIARLCRSCHGKQFAGPALGPVLLEAIMQY